MENVKSNQCPEFPYFGARYPDARCIDGLLHDMDIRKQIYRFIDMYVDTPEPKKLCSSIQDLVEELAEHKVKNIEVIRCSTQLKDKETKGFDNWIKTGFIPLGNNGFTNKNQDTVWTKSELKEIYDTIYL